MRKPSARKLLKAHDKKREEFAEDINKKYLTPALLSGDRNQMEKVQLVKSMHKDMMDRQALDVYKQSRDWDRLKGRLERKKKRKQARKARKEEKS
jgi:hypothetical protein